jgi:hypothetical protein
MTRILKLSVIALLALGLTACASIRGKKDEPDAAKQIAVNSFLWQASLDTLRFAPLISADPFGGVILSDWYQADQHPDERFKLTVYLLDSELRADAVSVNVNRQVRRGSEWLDDEAHPTTGMGLENVILSRARELRIAALES